MMIIRRSVLILLLLLSAGCVTSNTQRNGDPLQPSGEYDSDKVAEANTRLGYEYYRAGEYERARIKLQKALEHDPKRPDAHMWLGLTHEELKQLKEADAALKRAQELAPDNAVVRSQRLDFMCRQKRFAEAELLARENANGGEEPLVRLARCTLDAGEQLQAEAYLKTLLSQDPNHPHALLQLAALWLAWGRLDDCEALLNRYEAGHGANADSTLMQLRAAEAQGDHDAEARYATILVREYPGVWRDYQKAKAPK